MMLMMLTYYDVDDNKLITNYDDDADDLFYFLRLIMTVNTIIYHIDKKWSRWPVMMLMTIN